MSARSLPAAMAFIATVFLLSVVSVQAQGGSARGAWQGAGQAVCSPLPSVDRVMNNGDTREGWEALFSGMVSLPKEQATVIAEYLAKNFPESQKPPP